MTDAQPAWAKGFDMPFLKEVAAIYKADFGPHTYGAFGLPKERDVADAREAGQLVWTREGGQAIRAAAIVRELERPSVHEDFAGRKIVLAAGDILVRSIAGSPSAKEHLIKHALAHIRAAAHPPATAWVEAHVENAETVAILDRLGFRRMATKVSASSDLKGLFFLTDKEKIAAPTLDPADVPGLAVLEHSFFRKGEHAGILAELRAYLARDGHSFTDHYSSYNKRRSWSALALRGYAPTDPGFIIKPSEMSKAWKAENPARLKAECGPTIAADAFPSVWRALDRLPGGYQRVRFMRLASEGELTRHADITDPEAGTADGMIARLHIPLISPPECLFRSWGLDGAEERRHLEVGCLAYLDTRKPHAVINPGNAERIHLVVDAISSPELRRMIAG